MNQVLSPVTVYSKKVYELINSYQVCIHHNQRRLLQSAHPQRGSNDLFYLQQRAMDLSFYLKTNHKRYFKTPSFNPGIQHFLDIKLPPILDQSRRRKTLEGRGRRGRPLLSSSPYFSTVTRILGSGLRAFGSRVLFFYQIQRKQQVVTDLLSQCIEVSLRLEVQKYGL